MKRISRNRIELNCEMFTVKKKYTLSDSWNLIIIHTRHFWIIIDVYLEKLKKFSDVYNKNYFSFFTTPVVFLQNSKNNYKFKKL